MKNMANQPLSILFEKKRALNVEINKKTQAKQPEKEEQNGEPDARKPKKGGLKIKSKFDTKTKQEPKAKKSEQQSDNQNSQIPAYVNEEQEKQAPESAFRFASFGDYQSKPETKVQEQD